MCGWVNEWMRKVLPLQRFNAYPHSRSLWRGWPRFLSRAFAVLAVMVPFLAVADTKVGQDFLSEYVGILKSAFYISLTVIAALASRLYKKLDSNQTLLFDRQREFDRTLSNLLGAHNTIMEMEGKARHIIKMQSAKERGE